MIEATRIRTPLLEESGGTLEAGGGSWVSTAQVYHPVVLKPVHVEFWPWLSRAQEANNIPWEP